MLVEAIIKLAIEDACACRDKHGACPSERYNLTDELFDVYITTFANKLNELALRNR